MSGIVNQKPTTSAELNNVNLNTVQWSAQAHRVTLVDGAGGGVVDTLIDVSSATVTYIGKCVPGSDISDPIWQIKKLDSTANPTLITWADGNANFDNVWSDRATLTYSSYS